jgi:hypothetical protein
MLWVRAQLDAAGSAQCHAFRTAFDDAASLADIVGAVALITRNAFAPLVAGLPLQADIERWLARDAEKEAHDAQTEQQG